MKRYRKVMGLAIVLVALAVAINALAFKTATVTSSGKLTVSATGSAALGIDAATSPGTGFQVNNTSTSYAEIKFTDAMQPNSVYTFVNVFKIENNNSGPGRVITLSAPQITSVPTGVTITLKDAASGMAIGTSPADQISAGDSITVNVEITVGITAVPGPETSFGIVIVGTEN